MENMAMESRVLEFVTGYVDQNGYAPSYREIGRAVGLRSSSSVHKYVNILVADGKLNLKAKQSRAMLSKRSVLLKNRKSNAPLRIRLDLADGGSVYFDCSVKQSESEELAVDFCGIFDGSQLKNGVSRIVACTVEG